MFIILQAAAAAAVFVFAVKHLALKLPVSADYFKYFLTVISKPPLSSHDFSIKFLLELFFGSSSSSHRALNPLALLIGSMLIINYLLNR